MKRLFVLVWLGLVLAPAIGSSATADDVHAFARGSWQQLRNAHAGKPLIVHFWGVTCGPCRAEMAQ